MKYLSTMPECIEYVNEIKRDAFNKFLNYHRYNYLEILKSPILTKEFHPKLKDIMPDILTYILDEYIATEFDNLWGFASSEVMTKFVIRDIKKLLRFNKVINEDALSTYISKLGQKYYVRELTVMKLFGKLRREMPMHWTNDFHMEQVVNYLINKKS